MAETTGTTMYGRNLPTPPYSQGRIQKIWKGRGPGKIFGIYHLNWSILRIFQEIYKKKLKLDSKRGDPDALDPPIRLCMLSARYFIQVIYSRYYLPQTPRFFCLFFSEEKKAEVNTCGGYSLDNVYFELLKQLQLL